MDKKLYRETFSYICASEATITEVIEMAHAKKKRQTPLRVVVAIAAASTLVITGFAAGIISLPLGDDVDMQEIALSLNSLEQEKPQMEDTFGNALEMPDMQRGSMTEEQIAAILGDAMYTVDGTFTHENGNTYTLETFLMDENGMGLLTYTVSNLNGVDVYDAGYGVIAGGAVDIYLRNGASYEDGYLCDTVALQIGERSETEVRVLEKFGTFEPYDGDGVYAGREETPFGYLLPENYLATCKGVDSEGNTVSVSPLGLSIAWDVEKYEPILGTVELHFTDGSVYTVMSDSAWNADLSYMMTTEDGIFLNANYVFADLVDISRLQSIHVEGTYNGGNGVIVRDYTF